MMLIYIIITAILVSINPALGVVSVFLCLGIHILKSVIFDNEKNDTNNKSDSDIEFDEFDWWQDNQGL